MTNSTIYVAIAIMALMAFVLLRRAALLRVNGNVDNLHSLPRYHGYYAAVTVALPCIIVATSWLIFGNSIVEALVLSSLPDLFMDTNRDQLSLVLNRIMLVAENGALPNTDENILIAAEKFNQLYQRGIWATFALTIAAGLSAYLYAASKTTPDFRARNGFEKSLYVIIACCSLIAILVTIGIISSLILESLRFFQQVPLQDFLFGLKWSPQTALRADQVASEGMFGAVPLFAGTFLISFLAMLVAGPIGLLSAIYLTQYASQRTRKIAKPVLEILAGVPTVVYGFFAALTVAPWLTDFGASIGVTIASESALAAGLVMGIMIIPFVSSLSDDAITAVPNSLTEGSLALGATRGETITGIIIPAALPGIVSAFLLAISRAIGETMIVVMAVGLRPNLTANPLEAVTTVTVQIVALLTGDQEFDSTKTLSAFALGLALFVVTLVLNIIALGAVRKFRNVYE